MSPVPWWSSWCICTAGSGGVAAWVSPRRFLIGFNPSLLLKMQEATPMTLALAGAVAALLCYGWHLRSSATQCLPGLGWPRLSGLVAGGLCLGLSLLSLGGFGLLVLPVVLLHQLYLRAATSQASPSEFRAGPWWSALRGGAGAADGLLAIAIALIVAVPWHVLMAQVHGWGALAGLELRSWGAAAEEPGLLARVFELAPVTLPLGFYGAARAFRLALIDENNSPEAVGGSFC